MEFGFYSAVELYRSRHTRRTTRTFRHSSIIYEASTPCCGQSGHRRIPSTDDCRIRQLAECQVAGHQSARGLDK